MKYNGIFLAAKKCISFITIFLTFIFTGCSEKQTIPEYSSVNYKDGKFKNQYIKYEVSLDKIWFSMIQFFKDETPNKSPNKDFKFPILELTKEDILNFEDNSVVRFGHSTLLFKIDNRFVLTDPVFSDRVSPISFIGPKRFHKSPIALKDLPFIDIIVISHNHYDHMDKETLEGLKDKFGHMYVPLGLKKEIVNMGLDISKITELDWWDEVKDSSITLAATPAQYFSGRGLFDSQNSLWSSWVIKSSKVNVFFSGDSGYFKGFKQIGEKYGPFDMSFIENGAYNKQWQEIHMLPEQTIQAHIDVKAGVLFPIHNGTFELALHSWYDPFEKILNKAKEKNVKVIHPKMGEVVKLLEYKQTDKWWEK